MQNLEKGIRKNKIIMTIEIIALIVLLLYAITVFGDVTSAKEKVERSYAEQIDGVKADIVKIGENTAENDAKIADYDADIAALNADIEAIGNGTYSE